MGTQPCIPVCTCMDTNSQLSLLLTLFLCFLTLLSCTAPDKQHQKQHSHQPQREHPLTCSGIYLFNPLQLLYVCVCICSSPCQSVLSPSCSSFPCFCSSVRLCSGLLSIFELLLVVKVFKRWALPGTFRCGRPGGGFAFWSLPRCRFLCLRKFT